MSSESWFASIQSFSGIPVRDGPASQDRPFQLCLLRTLDELLDAPALIAAERPRLDDLHAVPRARLIFFVVRLVLLAPQDVLLVLAVAHAPRDDDDARLLHLVGGHDPGHRARRAALAGRLRRGGRLRRR